jgi:DNA-binding MarR family transcriptional regulator
LGHSAVVDALMALSRAVVAMTASSLNDDGTGVALSQYRTLIVLASRGPQRAADLAAELGVQPSTASRLCDRLVARGLVTWQPSRSDRRAVCIALTAAGRDLVGQAMARRRESLSDLANRVQIDDIESFTQTVEKLAVGAGELPEAQWWQKWERSTLPDAMVSG